MLENLFFLSLFLFPINYIMSSKFSLIHQTCQILINLDQYLVLPYYDCPKKKILFDMLKVFCVLRKKLKLAKIMVVWIKDFTSNPSLYVQIDACMLFGFREFNETGESSTFYPKRIIYAESINDAFTLE